MSRSEEDNHFDHFFRYIRILNRKKIYILTCVVAFFLVAAFKAKKLPNVYQARATIIFPQAPSTSTSSLSQALSSLLRTAAPGSGSGVSGAGGAGSNLTNILESRSLAEYVVKHFDMAKETSIEKAALEVRGNAEFSEDIGMIMVSYESTDPKQAAEIANYYPVALRTYLDKNFKEYRENLRHRIAKLKALIDDYDRMIDEGKRRYDGKYGATTMRESLIMEYDLARLEESVYSNFQILDSALVPEYPSGPHRRKIASIGALIGLAVGILLAFILEALDNRIHETGDIEIKAGIPVLGTLALNMEGNGIATGLTDISGQEKILAKGIEGCVSKNESCRRLVFTGVDEKCEKGVLIRQIGEALLKSGRKVLVINYSNENRKIYGVLDQKPASYRFRSMSNPAGKPPAFDVRNMSGKDQLLDSKELSQYDYVLVDAPDGIMSPLLFDLVEGADATFPVVKTGNTPAKELALHKESLEKITNRLQAIALIPPTPSLLSRLKKILPSPKVSYEGGLAGLRRGLRVHKIRGLSARLPKGILRR